MQRRAAGACAPVSRPTGPPVAPGCHYEVLRATLQLDCWRRPSCWCWTVAAAHTVSRSRRPSTRPFCTGTFSLQASRCARSLMRFPVGRQLPAQHHFLESPSSSSQNHHAVKYVPARGGTRPRRGCAQGRPAADPCLLAASQPWHRANPKPPEPET